MTLEERIESGNRCFLGILTVIAPGFRIEVEITESETGSGSGKSLKSARAKSPVARIRSAFSLCLPLFFLIQSLIGGCLIGNPAAVGAPPLMEKPGP